MTRCGEGDATPQKAKLVGSAFQFSNIIHILIGSKATVRVWICLMSKSESIQIIKLTDSEELEMHDTQGVFQDLKIVIGVIGVIGRYRA